MKRVFPALLFLAFFSASASAWEDGKLLIWINGDKAYDGIAVVGERFAEASGIPVTVEHPEGAPDKFFQAARTGKGPDIMIWAHDRLGEWADMGLLRPIEVDSGFSDAVFPKAWDAFRHNGRLWGYPISMETSGLIYNKALLSEEDVPASLDGIRALREKLPEGVSPLLWDYNNSYFTWGLLGATGAEIFGRTPDGGYDTSVVGVADDRVIAAGETLVSLIKDGILPPSLSYSVSESRMNDGKCAMFVSGPFAWANLEKSGIDFGVTLIPGMDGKPAKPFVGVLGAMINRASPNFFLAEEFLARWLITPEGLKEMDSRVPLGVPALKSLYEELAADDHIAGTMKNVEVGTLMPNIPQMGLFWSAMESAMALMTSRQDTPRGALENARLRMLGGSAAGGGEP
jgi:maltose/maltodextrin transport system substrate-binding protein